MRKTNILIASFVIASIMIIFSIWIQGDHSVPHNFRTLTEVTHKTDSATRATAVDEIEILDTASSNATSENTADIESPPLPRFELMATLTGSQNTSKASMRINGGKSQWFYIGDRVIENYFIQDINRSLVTLFEKSGAYYEISLFEPRQEEGFSAANEMSDIESRSYKTETDVENRLPLGDGQYISFGDEDVSNDTDEDKERSILQEVDTGTQTLQRQGKLRLGQLP